MFQAGGSDAAALLPPLHLFHGDRDKVRLRSLRWPVVSSIDKSIMKPIFHLGSIIVVMVNSG
jgi:hypothetical protein